MNPASSRTLSGRRDRSGFVPNKLGLRRDNGKKDKKKLVISNPTVPVEKPPTETVVIHCKKESCTPSSRWE